MNKYFEMLPKAERQAVKVIQLMLDMKNDKDGEGLFNGMTRHTVLAERLGIAASQSRTLREFWSRAFKSLLWSAPPLTFNDRVLEVVMVDNEREVLTLLRGQMSVLYANAVLLHQANKTERREAREERAKEEQDVTPVTKTEVETAGGLFNE